MELAVKARHDGTVTDVEYVAGDDAVDAAVDVMDRELRGGLTPCSCASRHACGHRPPRAHHCSLSRPLGQLWYFDMPASLPDLWPHQQMQAMRGRPRADRRTGHPDCSTR